MRKIDTIQLLLAFNGTLLMFYWGITHINYVNSMLGGLGLS